VSDLLWTVFAIVAGSAFIALAAYAFLWGRKRLQRRYLLRLIGRREEVYALRRSLEEAVGRLSDATVEDLAHFSEDLNAEERRTFQETETRARLLGGELDVLPVPSALIPVAEALADAATAVAGESGKVAHATGGLEVLDGLGDVDLAAVRTTFEDADRAVEDARMAAGLDDAAVYGGGLYI